MIGSKDFEQTIIAFRAVCLQRFPGDIHTLTQKERDKRLGFSSSTELSDLLAGDIKDPIDHIMRLLKTPRLLKTILRRTVHSWERLHGEIDFDDLLVANIIRFAAPEAYDFLLENYREIRGLWREGVLKDKEKRKELLQIKWSRMTNAANWDITAAEELLGFLFPMWTKQLFPESSEVPQGVRHSIPTDYWIRLNIEELGEKEVSDQETLHALVNWKKDRNVPHFCGLSLPEALFAHEQLAPKFEQFAWLVMDGGDFRNLASLLFEIILNKHGVKANSKSCAGFLSLWRMAIRTPIDQHEHNNWILDEIRKALPRSFRFANDLYYYWQSNSETDVSVKRPRPELREPIIQEARSLFQDSPERLIESLDSDFPYSVYHFVVHNSQPDRGGAGFNPVEWKWFADILLEAARLKPLVIIPQIVPLIVREEMTIHDFIYTFDKEMALQLFGDKINEVMALIAQPLDYSKFNERERRSIEFAIQTAMKFVKTPDSSQESI